MQLMAHTSIAVATENHRARFLRAVAGAHDELGDNRKQSVYFGPGLKGFDGVTGQLGLHLTRVDKCFTPLAGPLVGCIILVLRLRAGEASDSRRCLYALRCVGTCGYGGSAAGRLPWELGYPLSGVLYLGTTGVLSDSSSDEFQRFSDLTCEGGEYVTVERDRRGHHGPLTSSACSSFHLEGALFWYIIPRPEHIVVAHLNVRVCEVHALVVSSSMLTTRLHTRQYTH